MKCSHRNCQQFATQQMMFGTEPAVPLCDDHLAMAIATLTTLGFDTQVTPVPELQPEPGSAIRLVEIDYRPSAIPVYTKIIIRNHPWLRATLRLEASQDIHALWLCRVPGYAWVGSKTSPEAAANHWIVDRRRFWERLKPVGMGLLPTIQIAEFSYLDTLFRDERDQ